MVVTIKQYTPDLHNEIMQGLKVVASDWQRNCISNLSWGFFRENDHYLISIGPQNLIEAEGVSKIDFDICDFDLFRDECQIDVEEAMYELMFEVPFEEFDNNKERFEEFVNYLNGEKFELHRLVMNAKEAFTLA